MDEFRNNNIALSKQTAQPPEDANLTKRFNTLQKKFEESEAKAARLERQANDAKFAEAVEVEAGNFGLNPNAKVDLISRAKSAGFRHTGQGVAAFDAEGKVVPSKTTEGVQMTLNEWMAEQRDNGAGHLFQTSQGIGGQPGIVVDTMGEPAKQKMGRVFVNPTPEFVRQNIDKIASGEYRIQKT